MTTDDRNLDRLLSETPGRSLESTLFNLAHAYARTSDTAWSSIWSSHDADFAAPAIMCQSFAIELLLKFFLAIDHPSAATVADLERAGVKLKRHKYSELFDQLSISSKEKITASFAAVSGQATDAAGFRAALVALGDPFVFWRYVYEADGIAGLDKPLLDRITDALGKAAESERTAAAQRSQ